MNNSFLKHQLKIKGNFFNDKDFLKFKFICTLLSLDKNKILLKRKKKLFTLLSSVFVHKKSRKQFFFNRFVFSIFFREYLKLNNIRTLHRSFPSKSFSFTTTYLV